MNRIRNDGVKGCEGRGLFYESDMAELDGSLVDVKGKQVQVGDVLVTELVDEGRGEKENGFTGGVFVDDGY